MTKISRRIQINKNRERNLCIPKIYSKENKRRILKTKEIALIVFNKKLLCSNHAEFCGILDNTIKHYGYGWITKNNLRYHVNELVTIKESEDKAKDNLLKLKLDLLPKDNDADNTLVSLIEATTIVEISEVSTFY